MDVAGLISRFSTPGPNGGGYNVRRRTAGGFISGVAQQGTLTTAVITGSVQPISSQDLQRLPELRRTSTAFTMYTSFPLQAGDEGGAYEADHVELQAGVWFEVQESDTWLQHLGVTYYKVILQRPAVPANSSVLT